MNNIKIFKNLSHICKTINCNDDELEIIKYSQDWRRRIKNKALCVVFPKSENEAHKLKYHKQIKKSIEFKFGLAGDQGSQ